MRHPTTRDKTAARQLNHCQPAAAGIGPALFGFGKEPEARYFLGQAVREAGDHHRSPCLFNQIRISAEFGRNCPHRTVY